MPIAAIRTEQLRKVYTMSVAKTARGAPGIPVEMSRGAPERTGGEVVALDSLDLQIESGEFFGLLGPNGAGKTTTIGICTTRVIPTSGTAVIEGADVRTQPTLVRQRIGVVPQRPNPDSSLNVRENLVFHAAYFGIARALIHEPGVIFLDEPTVGLDPQARIDLWAILRELHAQGRTIVMTTHYMEEADQLCERVAIVDQGRLLAIDTPAALKARAPGGTMIDLVLDTADESVAAAVRAIRGVSSATLRGNTLRAYSDRGGEVIAALVAAAAAHEREVHDIHLAPPSLETLFISLTGRQLT